MELDYIVLGGISTLIIREIHRFFKERDQTIIWRKIDELYGWHKEYDDLGIDKKVMDLWDWHSVVDEEGVKIWYVRKSLETSIEKLADNISKMTEILTIMHQQQSAITEHLKNINKTSS